VLAYLEIRSAYRANDRDQAQHEHYIENLDEHKVFRIPKTAVATAVFDILRA
jgi:hypothetical protein